MNNILLSEKGSFDYEQEELRFLGFMELIFFISLLLFSWNVYTHGMQLHLQKNGTSILATAHKYTGGERITYVTEDGISYGRAIFDLFLEDHDDTIMVYYLDQPADAKPLTKASFFYTIYAISIFGIILSFRQIRRIKNSFPRSHARKPDK